jgi:hypothetical protein
MTMRVEPGGGLGELSETDNNNSSQAQELLLMHACMVDQPECL